MMLAFVMSDPDNLLLTNFLPTTIEMATKKKIAKDFLILAINSGIQSENCVIYVHSLLILKDFR